MRLAYITPVLGNAGGIGRIAEEYAIRFAKCGHEVTIFTPQDKNNETNLAQAGVKIEYLKPRLRYGHGAWVPDIKNKLNGFDIVHLHIPFLGGAGLVKKWRKKNPNGKLVITYHMDLVGYGIFKLIFRLYQKFVTPKILAAADKIFVSSMDYVLNGDLEKLLPKIKNKITEMPFGIDTEFFKPSEPDLDLLNKLNIKQEESVVLFVGGVNRAHYFKGVDILLKAFAILREEAKNMRLVIVGSGDRLNYYKNFAAKLKISDFVIFASGVMRAELPKYYSIADCLVLPSRDRSEAFGIVLLEAQACGVPVIASNLAGVRTVLKEGETGLLFRVGSSLELARSLVWLFSHQYELEVMGQNARERVLVHYNWAEIIQKMEKEYEILLDNKF